MSLSYFPRLLCLGLACFFLVNLVAGLLVAMLSPWAIRMAEKRGAGEAAGLLFGLRMLPSALALFAVAGLCMPSYVRFETELGAEAVGSVCVVAAVLGGVVCARALAWAGVALARSCNYVPQVAEEPVIALVGVFRPELVISPHVAKELSGDELEAVMGHERAHLASRDNLKRLAMLLAPASLPGLRLFGRLERAWAQQVEFAADDAAGRGEARARLALASALVRIARMGSGDAVVAARVERLLGPVPEMGRSAGMLVPSAVAMAMAVVASTSFGGVQELLEQLIR